jgi:hypothetical protein
MRADVHAHLVPADLPDLAARLVTPAGRRWCAATAAVR